MTGETKEDAIFTKEDFAMYNGMIDKLLRSNEQDVVTWIQTTMSDPANITALADWINIRKTGALRLEHKTLLVNTIKEELLKLFDLKQNLHSALASLPLIEMNVSVTILGQPISVSFKNLGFLKAEINISIPLLGWTIGFASPAAVLMNWEEEIEELILVKQSYLHSILETPLIEIK